jgi:hypothetical protein
VLAWAPLKKRISSLEDPHSLIQRKARKRLQTTVRSGKQTSLSRLQVFFAFSDLLYFPSLECILGMLLGLGHALSGNSFLVPEYRETGPLKVL